MNRTHHVVAHLVLHLDPNKTFSYKNKEIKMV